MCVCVCVYVYTYIYMCVCTCNDVVEDLALEVGQKESERRCAGDAEESEEEEGKLRKRQRHASLEVLAGGQVSSL